MEKQAQFNTKQVGKRERYKAEVAEQNVPTTWQTISTPRHFHKKWGIF